MSSKLKSIPACPRCRGAGEVVQVDEDGVFAVCVKRVCSAAYLIATTATGEAVLRSKLCGPNYHVKQKINDLKAQLVEARGDQAAQQGVLDAKPGKLKAKALASANSALATAAGVRQILDGALKGLARSEAEIRTRKEAVEKAAPKTVEAAEYALKQIEGLEIRLADSKRGLEMIFSRFPVVDSKLVGRNA